MTIKYAILGFLSWRPFAGYDLKKIFEDSVSLFYWSGSNNQIYKTLVQLLREGLVTSEVQHQESYPSRKLYTITEKGLSELKNWVLSLPEPPKLRNSFLIQLAWAGQLETVELNRIIEKYEYEVHMQLLMCQEQEKRGRINPARTTRESYIWKMINENWVNFYANELAWVHQLQKELCEKF
jgi:DNA-binding PadR family transcriptional regulator